MRLIQNGRLHPIEILMLIILLWKEVFKNRNIYLHFSLESYWIHIDNIEVFPIISLHFYL